MGSNISLTCETNDEGSSSKPKLDDIPENCAALVLMHLDPVEICKLAQLNRAFRGASSADFIWESKLPSNYRFILEKLLLLDSKRMMKLGKKDVYARLCRPHTFDDGTKEIWLDKNSGGVCISISYKALAIIGSDDKRYWIRISTDESRFQTVIYLNQIWWVEVDGEFEFQFPAGTYSMFFRLQLGKPLKRMGRSWISHDHICGWEIKPAKFELSTSDGRHAESQYFIDNFRNWVNYHVGDFVVEHPNQWTKIKFSLTQIDCTHLKGGLCLDSVLIWPSSSSSLNSDKSTT